MVASAACGHSYRVIVGWGSNVRDWVKSKDGIVDEKRNRVILNASIVLLFALMLMITATEVLRFMDATAKVDNTLYFTSQLHTQEDALFALDAATSRGLIIKEFTDAIDAGDLFVADSIRTRLVSARQLLLSESMLGFPKETRVDLARLLGVYLSYELSRSELNQFENSKANVIPLSPEVDTETLINYLQSLRVFQKNWIANLASEGLIERRSLSFHSLLVLIFILLGFIPLSTGIVTSRHFAREHKQLLNTQEYFDRLISSLPGVVLLTNRSGEIIAASEAASQFLGHPKDWYLQATMAQVLPKRFLQQYQLYSQNYLDSKADMAKGRELLVVDANGKELPVELHFGDFKTEEGDVLVVCLQDVSDRRAVDQRYQRVQRRFDMAMTASRDGLWDWDLESKEVIFSESWLEMVGIASGHPLDSIEVFEDCVLPEDRPHVKAQFATFLRSKDTLLRMEHRLRCRDGRVIDIFSRACAQRDSKGKVLRIVGVHSDVTSFKVAEREVLRLNRNLEDRVRLRTQQLENALASAEAANSAKAVFLSVMGHEIRTPMNGVIGMTDLLAKSKLDGEQKMMVDTVRRSSQSLLATLDNILDYVALESGSAVIAPAEFQLVEFVEGVADSFGQQIARNKQRFILHIDPAVPATVVADSSYLRKVLLNLLDNAIKFSVYTSPHGVIQLRLGLAADQSDVVAGQQRLEIKVIDNGIGISGEQRTQLFEPFVQIESTRARRFGGTGLGLAITAKMVHLMGGQIALTSSSGEDTCFAVQLLVEVPEVSAVVRADRDCAVFTCIPDETLRSAVLGSLEASGYEVESLESVSEVTAKTKDISRPVIVLAMEDDDEMQDYCDRQKIKMLKLWARPRDKAILRVDRVYTDPLLPSALLRVLEREQRVVSPGLAGGDTGL